jgi:hypothetical protein
MSVSQNFASNAGLLCMAKQAVLDEVRKNTDLG